MSPHRGGTAFLKQICIPGALLLSLSIAASAQTLEPLRLSRQQAIEEALVRNPALAAARAQVEEARANVVTAAAFADPTFAADVAGQTHILNPASRNASDQGFGVTLPFPGKRALRRDSQAYRRNLCENAASGAIPDASARRHQSCKRASSCSDDSVERSHTDDRSWRMA